MKRIYRAAVLLTAAATFTACSNEETIGQQQQQQPAIGFTPQVSRPATTRGLSVESASDVKSFDVWAYANAGKADEVLYMGYAMDGVEINSGFAESTLGAFKGADDMVWGYKVPGELAYWPASDMLQFVALSPAHSFTDAAGTAADRKTDVTYTFTDDTHDFAKTGQLGFTYTADNTAAADSKNTQLRDILAAANYQGYDINSVVTGTKNGNVPLKFRHLLSKIELKGQVNRLNKNIKVEISSIVLHNIQKTGTCKLNLDQAYSTDPKQDNFAADNNAVVWTASGDYVNYTITKNTTLKYDDDIINAAAIPDDNSEAVDLCNAEDNLFLIPQTITAWDHDAVEAVDRTISKADTDHTVYLEITAKITQNGITIHDGTVYVPLTTTGNQWKPGNRYVYTLAFGIGEDENGDNIGRPITFSCSVSPWITEENATTIEF